MTERHVTTPALIAAIAVHAVAACASPPVRTAAPTAQECVVVDDTARPHITVGVADAAGPPRPGAYSAIDILAGHVHETLVRVDCTGRVIPALARTWSSDADSWRFGIRHSAAFTDGTPATARSVAESLSLVPLLGGYVIMGEHDLAITKGGLTDVRVFARPELRVYRMGESGIPAGTGPYEPALEPRGRIVQLIARDIAGAQPMNGRAPDTISIRGFGTDLRQAIDAGVDALVTNDAATVAYARARTGYSVAPLTWSITYVLATATAADRVAVPGDAFPDAVVGAASRPASAPFWWDGCSPSVDGRDSGGERGVEPDSMRGSRMRARDSRDARILFLRDDPVARAIAERITALARGRAPEWLAGVLSSDAVPTAAGVDMEQLLTALESGRAMGIVVAMRRVEHGGCGALPMQFYRPLLAGWHVTPLIDTRDDLVYRPGIGRVTVDADGTIRFGGS